MLLKLSNKCSMTLYTISILLAPRMVGWNLPLKIENLDGNGDYIYVWVTS